MEESHVISNCPKARQTHRNSYVKMRVTKRSAIIILWCISLLCNYAQCVLISITVQISRVITVRSRNWTSVFSALKLTIVYTQITIVKRAMLSQPRSTGQWSVKLHYCCVVIGTMILTHISTKPLHPRPPGMVHYNDNSAESSTVPAVPSNVANSKSARPYPADDADNSCTLNDISTKNHPDIKWRLIWMV